MALSNINIVPLDDQALEVIRAENSDIVCDTLNQEDIDAHAQSVAALKAEQEELPLLKPSEESLRFFREKMDHERTQWEFRNQLEYTPIKAAIQDWLTNLSSETRRNYAYYMQDMIKRHIIPEKDASGNDFTVGHFRHVPHELVLDYIKRLEEWSEGTRQLHAAVYISFTAYLDRISQGWVRKVQPSTLAANPTFFQIREKCATAALSLSDWHRFIDALTVINERDSLIARALLHGAKRISEVITITLTQIDWDKNIIRFKQSKTGGTFREIPITYPPYFMTELKAYIEATSSIRKDSPHVFITRKGNVVTRHRLNFSFDQASKKAKLKIKVTPHVLRATWVTLVREQGASDSQIMQVTGHRNNKMVLAYDKTSDEINLSKKISFI